jgi:hypothetical protein
MRCIARRTKIGDLWEERRFNVAVDVVRDGISGDVACVRA